MDSKDIFNIGIENIYPHPENPRKDLGDLSELVESIKKNGVMQNLTVIPGHWNADGEYEDSGYTLIIGHRRHAAAKEAGLETVPCRVVEGMDRKEQLSTMLEENMQRSDLTVYEQAQGFQLMLDLGETEDSIAEKTGFSKTTIRRRLNIAKLDQDLLKEKEADEGFQMTISDLFVLEKVEDVETRNKILEDASDSRDLANRANRAVREALESKRKQSLIDMLTALGIEKAPDEASNGVYTGSWKSVKEFSFKEEIPAEITLEEIENDGAKMFYGTTWGAVRILCKVKKEKKELSPEEEAKKQIARNRKEIKSRMERMDSERAEFIMDIINGKIDDIKKDAEIRDDIWKVLVKGGAYFQGSTLRSVFLTNDSWKCTPEELAEAHAKVDALKITHQMLLIMSGSMKKADSIFDYRGVYCKDIGDCLLMGYEILKQYGWSFSDEDDIKILNGTHELYPGPDLEEEPDDVDGDEYEGDEEYEG